MFYLIFSIDVGVSLHLSFPCTKLGDTPDPYFTDVSSGVEAFVPIFLNDENHCRSGSLTVSASRSVGPSGFLLIYPGYFPLPDRGFILKSLF